MAVHRQDRRHPCRRKIVEVPQWQFIFNVIGIPVLAQRQDPLLRQLVPAVIVVVPMVQTVQKPSRIRRLPVQSPQVQSFRKVVGMPGCWATTVAHGPVWAENREVPQLQWCVEETTTGVLKMKVTVTKDESLDLPRHHRLRLRGEV